MLVHAVATKESPSSKAMKSSRSPKPQDNFAPVEEPKLEFVRPKYSWNFGDVTIDAPSDNDLPNAGAGRRMQALGWPLQAKLQVGAIDDPLEREADRVAEQVMRMPEPRASADPEAADASSRTQAGSATASAHGGLVQRKCSCGGSCEKCRAEHSDDEQGRIQRKPAAPQISRVASSSVTTGIEAPPVIHEVLRSPGRPLDAAVRTFMESRFGHDFSQVRVHTDRRAAESAESIHALAYTAGQDIAFSHNTYAPSTHHGRELLGHELAHTIQQRRSGGIPPSPAPDGIFESSANAAGRTVANGQSISADFPACGVGLARSLATPEFFNDEDLARAIQDTSDRLKQASYPGRDSDVDWMEQLKAVAARRARFKQPPTITPSKPAPTPKPPRRDSTADRAAAVAEAEATAAQIDQELKTEDDDEPLVTPMAISSSKSTVKPAAKASAKSAVRPAATVSADRARQKTPDPAMARFLPGGFKDEDIYKDSDAEMKRIDERIARDREIAKTPYKERLQTVRIKLQTKSDYWYSRNEAFSHMTGAEVWSEGMADGLFIESEKQSVYEDQESHVQFINEEMAKDARNRFEKFESDRYRAWVDQGEQLSAPQTIIQPLVVAAAAPELVAAAYFGAQTGLMAGETYDSCVHGTKEECAAAAAQVAAQFALERAIKGRSGEAPTRSEGKPSPPEDLSFPRGTPAPEPATPEPLGAAKTGTDKPVTKHELEQSGASSPTLASTKGTGAKRPPAVKQAGGSEDVAKATGKAQGGERDVGVKGDIAGKGTGKAAPRQPYLNNNPEATPEEMQTGELLDGLAQDGKLKRVSRVEGAPEIEGSRSGDYRFVESDFTRVRGDLIEPETTNTRSIVSAIFKKSGQTEVAVVRLGRGTSSQLTLEQANGIAHDVVRTPGITIDRVIVIKGGVVIVDLP